MPEAGGSDSAVYLHYDQAALDAQYDQRTLVRDPGPYEREWREGSDAARALPGLHADLAYGEGSRECLDLLLPRGDGPFPLVAFFHGGGWTRHDKSKFAFPAPAFLEHGIAFAVVGFDPVPQVRLESQVAEARAAVEWLQDAAGRLGIDADAVFAAGHSSGAHLAASLVTGDDDVPPADVKGALLVSGIYDLEPVRLSARNEYLKLDATQALALSPIARIQPDPCPLVVAWGGGELDEFQRQSAAFADAWEAAGGAVTRVHRPRVNHFAITRELADPTGEVLAPFFDLIEAPR